MRLIVNSPKGGTAIVDPFKKRIVEYRPSQAYVTFINKQKKLEKIDKEEAFDKKRLRQSFNKVVTLPTFVNKLFNAGTK